MKIRTKIHRINALVIAVKGRFVQTYVCIEELSELIKELTKWLRGYSNREHIIEETADALICIEQLIQIHRITDEELDSVIEQKLNRTKHRLEEQTID